MLFRYDCWNLLTAEERKRAYAYYQRPLKLLCVGGLSFNNAMTAAVPDLDDAYKTVPMLGPPTAWTQGNAFDRYARHITRQQGWAMSVDDLLLPLDEDYVFPDVRPRGCRGNRTVGSYTITETADETTVTYTPTGKAEISGTAERVKAKTMVKVTK